MTAAVFQSVTLPERQGTVTLYDWMADEVSDGRNLIRTDDKGVELWRAKPPLFDSTTHEDCFTNVMWDGSALTAHSFTGYRVAVDLDTGQVTVLEFTK